MRISFDIDDTLVCGPATPTEPTTRRGLGWAFREPLRQGTAGLLRELSGRGHELWVYTTSYRSPWYLRLWFRSLGVRLSGVVNADRHRRVVSRVLANPPSKYPPAFGIHLHVDDSEGVAIEGRVHQFRVLVVTPDDPNWVEAVRAATGSKRR